MSRRPRILVICEFYPENGSDWKGVFIRDYVDGLRPYAEVEVFASRPRAKVKMHEERIENGVRVIHHVSAARGGGRLTKWRIIRRWMNESMSIGKSLQRPDIIHVHNSVLQGRLAMRLADAWSVPFVVSEHTGPFSSIADSPMKRRMAARVIAAAELLLTVSERTRAEVLAAGIRPKRSEVSYNPVDTETFALGRPGPHVALAFVSRMDEFKGALKVVKAFRSLARTDLSLKMVGSGEEYEAVRQYVMKHDMQRQVMLYGTLSKSEIYDVIKRTDLLVFPSRHESFGLVAAEAWATGIPVIIGKDCGAAEWIEGGDSLLGESCPSDDINALASAIERQLKKVISTDREAIRKVVVDRASKEAFGRMLWERLSAVIEAAQSTAP